MNLLLSLANYLYLLPSLKTEGIKNALNGTLHLFPNKTSKCQLTCFVQPAPIIPGTLQSVVRNVCGITRYVDITSTSSLYYSTNMMKTNCVSRLGVADDEVIKGVA